MGTDESNETKIAVMENKQSNTEESLNEIKAELKDFEKSVDSNFEKVGSRLDDFFDKIIEMAKSTDTRLDAIEYEQKEAARRIKVADKERKEIFDNVKTNTSYIQKARWFT